MWLTAVAFAAPHVGVTAGVEGAVNDRLLTTIGVHGALSLRIGASAQVVISGGVYPYASGEGCDNPSWSQLLCQVSEAHSARPALIVLRDTADATVRILPFRTWLGGWQGAAGLMAGGGVVYSQLIPAEVPYLPEVDAYAPQLHPAAVGGVVTELRHGHLLVSAHLRDVVYAELKEPTPDATAIEDAREVRHVILVGVEGGVWF